MTTIKTPPCLSNYDLGDVICNGDPDGATIDDRKFCGWRDRCGALKAHLATSKKPVSVYLKIVNPGKPESYGAPKAPDAFIKFLDLQVKRYGVKSGIPSKEPGDAPEAAPKAARPRTKEMPEAEPNAGPELFEGKEASFPGEEPPVIIKKRNSRRIRKMVSQKVKAKHAATRELWDTLKDRLTTQIAALKFAAPGQVAIPGQLYMRDHGVTSQYVRVYQKTASGKDRPIVAARFKPRTLTIDVELPVKPDLFLESVGKAAVKSLKVQPLADGFFSTLVMNVDAKGTLTIVDAIQRMVHKGKFPLAQV